MSENTQVKLRPLSVVQIFTQAVLLYRRNFFKFTAIFALVLLPVLILSLAMPVAIIQEPGSPSFERVYFNFFAGLPSELLAGRFVAVAQNVVEWPFLLLAGVLLVHAVSDAYLGRARGVFETFREAFKPWWRLLLSSSLVLLVLLGFAVVMWQLAGIPYFGWFLAGLLGGLPIFSALVLLPFLIPVVVLEKQSLLGSLRRVWDLVRARFLITLGCVAAVLLLVSVVQILVAGIFQFLLQGILISLSLSSMAFFLTSTLVQTSLSLLLLLVFIPLQVTLLVGFYLDLRVRDEGADDLPSLLSQAPPPSSEPLLRGREWGYWGCLTLISVLASALIILLLLFLTEVLLSWW